MVPRGLTMRTLSPRPARLGLLALLLLLGALIAPPSVAGEPAPEKKLSDQAKQFLHEGRFADARDVYLTLWRLYRDPDAAFNVGTLSYRVHDWTTAAEYLTLYYALPDAVVDEATQHARVDLEESRKHVGTLYIQVSDPGAEVTVDEKPVGVSPLPRPIFVMPGQHRLVAMRDGTQTTRNFSVKAGDERILRLVIPSESALASSAAKDAAKERVAPVTAGVSATPQVPPLNSPVVQLRRVGLGLSIGAVAAGAGLAVASGVLRVDAEGQAKAIRDSSGGGGCKAAGAQGPCGDLRDTVHLSSALAGGAVFSFTAGAVLGAATWASWGWVPSDLGPRGKQVQVRAAVTPTGLVVKGTW